ncbi:MAG: type I 3-dehydroquinate dehydratase [Candidatus Aureabacteria bacterium]|nr:type I 3-dehydroquinate dehydratase [Candidatus Auribacterota bacterium]
MNSIKIGQLSIGAIPRIVGTVSSQDIFQNLDSHESLPCDIIELRLDEMWPVDDWWMEKCASLESLGYPVILTIRAENEGGNWKGTMEERFSIFTRALPSISAVDIELSNGVSSKICEHAAKQGIKLLISFHDFNRTPPIEELLARVSEARAKGADIAKIATMVNSAQDITVLSSLTAKASKDNPICVIGMGKHGVSTRLSLPAIGSALTYGYLDKPSAPGQLPCSSLCQRLREVVPSFNEDLIIRKQILEYV